MRGFCVHRIATIFLCVALLAQAAEGDPFYRIARIDPVQPLTLSGFGGQAIIGDGFVVARSGQYLLDPPTQSVDVFNSADGSFLRTIPVNVGDAVGNVYGLDSLSIDQGRLLVGASGSSSGTPHEAQLFDLTTGTLLQSFTLPSLGQGFGFAVEVNGPWALIGDPIEDRVHVFDTASGDLVTTLVPPGPPGEIFRFGKDIVIDGNRAAIADHGRNSVFIYDTQTWTLERTISKTSDFINWFGASIDLEGDTLVIGAMANTAFGPALGGVFVYDLSKGSELELLPDEYQWHVYGADVALHGNTVAVGGTAAGWDIYRWGSVGIFDATTGEDLARIFPPEPNWATAWGWALDFDEQGRLAIGDFLQSYDDGVNFYDRVGRIHIYQVPEPGSAVLALVALLVSAGARYLGPYSM